MSMQKGSNLWHFLDSEVKRFFATAPRIYSSTLLDALAFPAVHQYSRLLVVTPKRIGSAPKRNRIRRQLKEIFRTNPTYYTLPFDLLLIVKQRALKKTYTDLEHILKKVITAGSQQYKAHGLKPRKRMN